MMNRHSLRDCHVLVVEDEYLVAEELELELLEAGAVVIGPVATVAAALALIETEARIDGAVLDANLGGELVYPVADRLLALGVPLIFTTGYDASTIPATYKGCLVCEKPVHIAAVARAMEKMVAAKRLSVDVPVRHVPTRAPRRAGT
jgi:CheY-like chemotaxis protein